MERRSCGGQSNVENVWSGIQSYWDNDCSLMRAQRFARRPGCWPQPPPAGTKHVPRLDGLKDVLFGLSDDAIALRIDDVAELGIRLEPAVHRAG